MSSITDKTARRMNGVNWAAMIQEKIPLDEASNARLSERFNARPFDWLTAAVRISLNDPNAGEVAWGATLRVQLVRDLFGDGQQLFPVAGSADTVKVTASAAANVAISAIVEFDAEAVIERIPARGLGDVVAKVSTAHATAGTTMDLLLLGWSGALPVVPSDLIRQVLG